MAGVQEAMTVRGLEADQLMDREEWRLVSGGNGRCHDTGNMYLIVYRCGAWDSICACHAAGPGSIPGQDMFPG